MAKENRAVLAPTADPARLAPAQERWRRFNGHHLVADVVDGAKFKDGIWVTHAQNHDDRMTDEKVDA